MTFLECRHCEGAQRPRQSRGHNCHRMDCFVGLRLLAMTKTIISRSENETSKIAKDIANDIDYPAIICLYGDLGAGKTAFCRALIRHLCGDNSLHVPSPTYSFVQTYNDDQIWHFDLYRMQSPAQLYDIGWEEALTARVCLIEWPERLGAMKTKNTVDIHIESLPDNSRRITLMP